MILDAHHAAGGELPKNIPGMPDFGNMSSEEMQEVTAQAQSQVQYMVPLMLMRIVVGKYGTLFVCGRILHTARCLQRWCMMTHCSALCICDVYY